MVSEPVYCQAIVVLKLLGTTQCSFRLKAYSRHILCLIHIAIANSSYVEGTGIEKKVSNEHFIIYAIYAGTVYHADLCVLTLCWWWGRPVSRTEAGDWTDRFVLEMQNVVALVVSPGSSRFAFESLHHLVGPYPEHVAPLLYHLQHRMSLEIDIVTYEVRSCLWKVKVLSSESWSTFTNLGTFYAVTNFVISRCSQTDSQQFYGPEG